MAELSQTALAQARAYHTHHEERRRQEREALRQEWYRKAKEAILQLAPHYPQLHAVYLFGSLIQPGRFGTNSDIDVAVECDDPATESRFWQELEAVLQTPVDLRPCRGAVSWAVSRQGECIYAREIPASGTEHST